MATREIIELRPARPRRRPLGPRDAAVKAGAYVVLCAIGFVMAVPLAWMIATSLKDPSQVMLAHDQWLPRRQVASRYGPLYAARVNGVEVSGAEIARSPQGRALRIIEPRRMAGRILTVPANRTRPVERVHLHWKNYVDAWTAIKVESAFGGLLRNADAFMVFYLNSILVAVAVTLGQVATSSLAAYAFARLRFPGRDSLFLGYLATLMVPAVITMIPVYILLSRLRLTDTYWALILPGMFSAYGTFMLRQFFLTVPRDIEDAARIDGASLFGVYWRIIMPLSKPALAALTTFVFLHTWNDFMWPLIVIDSLRLKTLPIGLAQFQGPYVTEWHLLMAASVIVMVPVLIVFVAGQRYFVRGIILSGLKA
jgi:multiple sugar transport system permease protein